MRWWGLAGALVACSDPGITLPFPTSSDASLLLFTVSEGQVSAYAIDHSERPSVLVLPTSFEVGTPAALYAIGLDRSVSELGLQPGPFQSAEDPGTTLVPTTIFQADFDGEQISSWMPGATLPPTLLRFRLPPVDDCTRFDPVRVDALDGEHPVGAVGIDGGRAMVLSGSQALVIDGDGRVIERAPLDWQFTSIARGPSGVWIVGGRTIARAHTDPLVIEVVSTSSVTEKPVRFLAVGPGANPELYGVTGGGEFARIWPSPTRLIEQFTFDGNDLGNGGVVALDVGHAIAVHSAQSSVSHWVDGRVVPATPPGLVIGYSGAILDRGEALLLEAPSGDLVRFDGRRFERLDLRGIATIKSFTPFRDRYAAVTELGQVFEYAEGRTCELNPDQVFHQLNVVAPIADGLLVGGLDADDRGAWYVLRPR